MSLVDRIKQEAETGGYSRHPNGTFPAKIVDIVEKEHEGDTIYEFHIETEHGKVKKSIWRVDEQDIERRFGENISQADAEDRLVKAIGGVLRLYKDLGAQMPDGELLSELADSAYTGLGDLIDRPCQVVIAPNKHDPSKQVIFINRPLEKNVVKKEIKKTANRPVKTKPIDATKPTDDHVPF